MNREWSRVKRVPEGESVNGVHLSSLAIGVEGQIAGGRPPIVSIDLKTARTHFAVAMDVGGAS